MTVQTRPIPYDADGVAFEGLMAWDDAAAGPRPAVMICHAWSGRSGHEEEAARRLAEQGYAAMAADVYGKGVLGTTNEERMALMTPLAEDRGRLGGRLSAGLAALTAQAEADAARVVVSGYCFGGLCALDLARANAPVRGAAAFHAILGAPGENAAPITPKVIAFQGFDDPMADADAQRAFAEEMTTRKADWQLHLYGGVSHAFTNQGADTPEMGLIYDAAADARSWASFLQFLGEATAG